MDKTVPLTKKRAEIKEHMKAHRSLPEHILDGVGALTTPRGKNAPDWGVTGLPTYWINGLVIALLTFLIGWLTSQVLGELVSLRELYLMLWGAATGALALIANKVNMRLFLEALRGSLLDKFQSIANIEDLNHWLNANFRIARPFVSGLILGPVLAVFLYRAWLINNRAAFHYGTFAVIVLACIQAIWVVYYFYPFYVSLPARLSRYKYDLYTIDPSSSEVVGRLSQLLTYILYITMAYIVGLTIGLAYFNVLTVNTGAVFSLLVWAPTVMLYAAGQFHLSGLISRAKWKILNEVQTKIETLYKKETIPQKETLQRLDQLMDYHDRIKSTPNSALNLRSSLNFLNSLLLPILAFVIANIEKVLDAIKRLVGN